MCPRTDGTYPLKNKLNEITTSERGFLRPQLNVNVPKRSTQQNLRTIAELSKNCSKIELCEHECRTIAQTTDSSQAAERALPCPAWGAPCGTPNSSLSRSKNLLDSAFVTSLCIDLWDQFCSMQQEICSLNASSIPRLQMLHQEDVPTKNSAASSNARRVRPPRRKNAIPESILYGPALNEAISAVSTLCSIS